MSKQAAILQEAGTGRVILARVEAGTSLWQRTVGLMGRRGLDAEGGLWLEPCNGIHTCFLRFPIDVIVLDGEGRVLRMAENVRSWRIFGPVRGGRVIVEMPAGTIRAKNIRAEERYRLA